MYYYVELAIPPLTSEYNPKVITIKLAKGLLDFVDVGIPEWINRLAKCRIFYNAVQVLPFNRDSWFTGDNATIRIPLSIQMIDDPYEITIHGYNLDDTFSHQLSFGFSVSFGEIQDVTGLVGLSDYLNVLVET